MEKRISTEVNRPEAFVRRMECLLGSEYLDFKKSYIEPARYGLRANRLKITPNALATLLPYLIAPIPWCADGFTYPADIRPAKSWAYHAGLFYIQEPSAMCPVSVLDAQPGYKVLDICAAPGGKSAQLAGQLRGKGLLVANDASASRCNALIRNLEMAGVTNAVVLNEQPKRLAERFAGFFDRILVDAPCSGEGMFRRDADAVKGWAENKPEACVRMQREILHYTAIMLKPGGRLVYSTCTFGPDENENVIDSFLSTHPNFDVVPINHASLGITQAKPEWVGARDEIQNAARIWPHKADGEGHFIALLERNPDATADTHTTEASAPMVTKHIKNNIQLFTQFMDAYIKKQIVGRLVWHERSLFAVPESLPDMSGLRVARGGWYLGDAGKDRFTPSQAMAMGLTREEADFTVELTPEDTMRYLRGESLSMTEPIPGKPWVLVCIQGYPLGWARCVDGRLKNARPPGWATN